MRLPARFAELHAGRISKHDPCKPAAKKEWRTIDEHFPLLKHSGPISPAMYPEHTRPWRIGAAIALALIIVAALVFTDEIRSVDVRGADKPRRPAARVRHGAIAGSSTYSVPSYQPTPASPRTFVPPQQATPWQAPITVVPPADELRRHEQARLDQERLAREESQRQQAALADQLRAQKQQQEEARKRVAGTDTIVPLDTPYPVTVGASIVTVKVHDNNISSFEIWINGQHYPDVQKNKGITGSRTDETLVYRLGNAELYYVWELSGQLNRCRLRVRES